MELTMPDICISLNIDMHLYFYIYMNIFKIVSFISSVRYLNIKLYFLPLHNEECRFPKIRNLYYNCIAYAFPPIWQKFLSGKEFVLSLFSFLLILSEINLHSICLSFICKKNDYLGIDLFPYYVLLIQK